MIRLDLTAAETSLLLSVLSWHIDSGDYCGNREHWYRRTLTVKDKITDAIMDQGDGSVVVQEPRK